MKTSKDACLTYIEFPHYGCRFASGFLKRNGNSKEAQKLVKEAIQEIKVYEKFKSYYGYGMYVARKTG